MIRNATETAQATVIALVPEIHNSIKFQYSVSGRSYGGLHSGLANSGLQVGQKVDFHYVSSDPSKGYIGMAPAVYTDFLLVAVLSGVLALLFMWKWPSTEW